MNYTPAQLLNPGIITYDEKRRKTQERYQKAVKRASFLSKKEKKNWALLGYMLSSAQLREGEKLIINEDLRLLKMRRDLEKIKPEKQ